VPARVIHDIAKRARCGHCKIPTAAL